MNVPTLFRVAMVLLPIALVIFLAGFGSAMWIRVNNVGFNFGLWVVCLDGEGCRSYNFGEVSHVYFARAATVAGLICIIFSMVFLAMFIYKTAKPMFVKTAYAMALVAGIAVLLGSAVFIGRENSLVQADVGWSGILCIISSIMMIAAGVCIFLPVQQGQVEFQQP